MRQILLWLLLCCFLATIIAVEHSEHAQGGSDGEQIEEQPSEEVIHRTEEEAFMKQIKNELGDVEVGSLTSIGSRKSYLEELRENQLKEWKATVLQSSKTHPIHDFATENTNHGDSFDLAEETDHNEVDHHDHTTSVHDEL